ncbi:MAG: MATE family efflux transporter [Clostridia bacterium]|nr:MATE family efflux transporter [Clostridia bacterium]
MQINRELFEKTPVPRALAALAVPSIISQLITMVYNIADTIFIGMANDPSKTAAASLSFVLVFAMNCFGNLFGVGGGSLISRLLGEKKDSDAAQVASFSFWGSILLSAIYSLLVFAFIEPLMRLLGATDSSVGYAIDYAFYVIVLGAVPATASLTLANLLRSEGRASYASFGLGMGGILNIILDPLFMFVILEPGNEVKGAAIATMLSNVVVLIYFLCVFLYLTNKTVLSISPKICIPEKKYVYSVFAVGFPSALSSLFACISNLIINNLASSYSILYGDVPVAAIGIAKKIDMLPMNVSMGLCQGMMPLVAYNYSAGNYKRMNGFTKAARNTGIAFAAICIIVFQLFGNTIVRLFIGDEATVSMGTDFLRILCLTVPLLIINVQTCYTFQAMGMGKQSLLLSSMRQGLVHIPLLFIMNYALGLYGIIWAQLISDSLTCVISLWFYVSSYRKLFKGDDKDIVAP